MVEGINFSHERSECWEEKERDSGVLIQYQQETQWARRCKQSVRRNDRVCEPSFLNVLKNLSVRVHRHTPSWYGYISRQKAGFLPSDYHHRSHNELSRGCWCLSSQANKGKGEKSRTSFYDMHIFVAMRCRYQRSLAELSLNTDTSSTTLKQQRLGQPTSLTRPKPDREDNFVNKIWGPSRWSECKNNAKEISQSTVLGE